MLFCEYVFLKNITFAIRYDKSWQDNLDKFNCLVPDFHYLLTR